MAELKFPKDRVLLTRADLKKLGIEKSNVSLLRAEAASRFPRRARLNGCSVVWFREEIEAYLKSISEARSSHKYSDLR